MKPSNAVRKTEKNIWLVLLCLFKKEIILKNSKLCHNEFINKPPRVTSNQTKRSRKFNIDIQKGLNP